MLELLESVEDDESVLELLLGVDEDDAVLELDADESLELDADEAVELDEDEELSTSTPSMPIEYISDAAPVFVSVNVSAPAVTS